MFYINLCRVLVFLGGTEIMMNFVMFHRSYVTYVDKAYASQNDSIHSLFFVSCCWRNLLHDIC